MEAVFQIDYRGRLVVAAAAGAVDDLFHLFARYIANQAQFFGQILASLLQHGLILQHGLCTGAMGKARSRLP